MQSPGQTLSALEREVLNIVQSDFPLTHAPYAEIAKRVSQECAEEEVHACILGLIERRVIRRLGGIFDTKKLGFASVLAAMRVPEERLDHVAQQVSALAGVSHNYRRTAEYNLWFTLATESQQTLDAALALIRESTGITDMLVLPALRTFKIQVSFEL